MPATLASHVRLTPKHVAQYHAEGYTLFRDQVLSSVKFAGLKSCFERILANRPAGMRPEQLDVPHFLYPELFEWLFDDQVLNLVESLIGPDIALYSSHFLCKPPGDGKRVPWHEDSSYWRGTFPEDQMDVCTMWLAIDDSDEGNGAMQIIPGTHLGKGGYSDYEPVTDRDRSAFDQEIRSHLFDAKRAVTCSLKANQASLHHAKLMHGSPLNTSNRRRCGYTMRYISTRSHFNHELRGKGHQMYLARGTDHAGNRYGDPSKPALDLLAGRGSLFRAGH